MSSVNNDNLLLFSYLNSFVISSCLITMNKSFRAMSNLHGDGSIPKLLADFKISLLSIMSLYSGECQVFEDTLHQVLKVFFHIYFAKSL